MSDQPRAEENVTVDMRYVRHRRKGLYVHINDVIALLREYPKETVLEGLEDFRGEF